MGESFQNPCDDHDRRKRVKCCSKRGAKCQRGSRCRTCRCRRNRIYSDDSERCVRRLPTTQVYLTTGGGSTRFESSTPKSRPVPIQTSQSSYVTSGTNSTRSYWSKKSDSLPVKTTAFSYVSQGSQDPASGNSTERPAQTAPRSSPSKRNRRPRPPKHKSKTTVKPRTTTYPQKASTTGSQGNKDMIRGGNKSNAAAIAGAIVGVIILIVLAAVFLYLRKRKQKKGAKDVNGKAPLDIHFNDLKSREEAVSPSSPDGIYTYADAGTISRPNGSTLNAVGNPAYSDNIPISEPFYNVLEADQNDSQPIYREVVPEQVYMDPNENRNAGGNQDQQEQPIYRELEEEPPAYAPIDQPIYRELEEETPASPVYADITSSTVENTGAQSPRQYQELNYAATANVYQPLDNDWKSQKYNR